jgi:HlyD family secretion protein
MSMTIRPSRLILWSSGLLLAALLAWSFRPQPVPADIAVLRQGTLRVTIDEDAITRVRERYVVAAPVAGRMQRVELEPGDPVVARRTVLVMFLPVTPALLDTRTRAETEARVKAAQATREQAQVALQLARADEAYSQGELKRQQEIASFGGTTDERVAAVKMDARTKEAQVNAAALAFQRAEHELDAARAALQQVASPQSGSSSAALTLRSPVDGIVLRVLHESEAPVAAGTPLIEIGNPYQLEIVADLLSTDAVNVQPGCRVIITGWGGSEPISGHVRLVEPAGFTKISALGVEEQRVNVLIDFDDTGGETPVLGDGYRAEVSIIVWERAGVLKIPTSALFRTGDVWTVFAVRDGRATQTTVQIGRRNAIEAEVLSQLVEGDRVIVHPGDTIADGVRVTPR